MRASTDHYGFLRIAGIVLVALQLSACGTTSRATLPEKIVVQHDIPFARVSQDLLDIYQPANPDVSRPVVIFFYGGGWRNGDKKEYAFVGQSLASRGIVTVVANYRLFPQAGFPDFLNDGADAVSWAVHNAARYGGDPRHIVLMGHSTGGYMATMLALDGQYLARDGLSPADLSGVIGLAGLYDFTDKARQEYAPIFNDAASLAAIQPLAHVTSSGRVPPMLLLTGTRDEAVPPENTAMLADRLHAAGLSVSVITYPDIGHIGIMLPFSPLSHNNSTIVDDVTGFVFGKGEILNGKGT